MDIKEVRMRKGELKANIEALLAAFTKNTGLDIGGVNLSSVTASSSGKAKRYCVNISIQLEI